MNRKFKEGQSDSRSHSESYPLRQQRVPSRSHWPGILRPLGVLRLAAACLLLAPAAWSQQSSSSANPAHNPSGPALHDVSIAQAIDYAAKNSVIVKNALL